MRLVDGVHHITFLTEDMDRLLAFYVRVFDAEVTLDMTEEGLRHAFLEVGATTVLHPFQMPEGPGPPPPAPMFSRGRLDHFALLAPSEEAFRGAAPPDRGRGRGRRRRPRHAELLDHGLL